MKLNHINVFGLSLILVSGTAMAQPVPDVPINEEPNFTDAGRTLWQSLSGESKSFTSLLNSLLDDPKRTSDITQGLDLRARWRSERSAGGIAEAATYAKANYQLNQLLALQNAKMIQQNSEIIALLKEGLKNKNEPDKK